jgi:hypothetical protein
MAYALCHGNVSWYAHAPRDVVGSALVVAGVILALVAVLGPEVLNLSTGRAAPEETAQGCDTDLRAQR